MSPRAPDPAVRKALVDRAAAILATDGPAKLTLRRLTREVGVSTMAVYTHFGSMEQLHVEVCNEGFRRFAGHLGSVGATDDPTADVRSLGDAYLANARENPNFYRAMFIDALPVRSPEVDVEWHASFEVLVDAVKRCVDATPGSIDRPTEAATALWGGLHGLVALELSGLLDPARTDAAVAEFARRMLVPYENPRRPRRQRRR